MYYYIFQESARQRDESTKDQGADNVDNNKMPSARPASETFTLEKQESENEGTIFPLFLCLLK